jgi:hypothetical protein
MELIVNLGCWDVLVRTPLREQIQILKELFHGRTSEQRRDGVLLLTCDIIDDSDQFTVLNKSIDFDGPLLDISPHVNAKYSLSEGTTYIKVQYTAILELTDVNPTYARVFLEPLSASGNSRRPLPEAFFYPLLVEWLRNFNAYLVHCGAVSINGKAVILIGQPGSGKSTHVLRMLMKGAKFLADDLLIMKEEDGEITLMPFREVANLGSGTVERFADMAFLTEAPRRGEEFLPNTRGDGKYQVSIADHFGQKAVATATPGFVLHLYHDQTPWIRERSPDKALEGIHNMNWFVSRPTESTANFFVLTELMTASRHLDVSQGYLAENLDEFVEYLTRRLT